MRKFIVSDLHGNGDVYDSIMGYLDNMSTSEKVELYINGDLIDRGLDSYRMFLDIYERINGKGKVKIIYLGGNHEELMYQAMMEKKLGIPLPNENSWIQNGGRILEREYLNCEKPRIPFDKCHHFLGSLAVYHLFDEKLAGKRLLLVHAQAPERVRKNCNIHIKDNNVEVERAIWTRETDESDLSVNRIGKDGLFTIVGHTPVFPKNSLGYLPKDDWIVIDGGCASYAKGYFDHQYVPLVEVLDGRLHIITFNHNNEIVSESFFDGNDVTFVSNSVDKRHREIYIDHVYDGQAIGYQKRIISHLKNKDA